MLSLMILMKKFMRKVNEIVTNKTIMKKVYFTLGILAIYRLLIFIPVPFVDISSLMKDTFEASWAAEWFGYLVMLMWGALENFAIIAIWVSPYITASIILQLLTSVVPALEELTEQWEVGHNKINQYTRLLTVPMAFLQWIWMTFLMNSMLGWHAVSTDITTVLLVAFVLTVWAVMLMWLWELITEKWVSNWISLLIFASIVSGIFQKWYNSLSWDNWIYVLLFMVAIVLVLIVLSIFILKSTKEIPVIYTRSGKVQQSSILPIPMNPVWMVPIIFAMAFVSFPYLCFQLLANFMQGNEKIQAISDWIDAHLNIYSAQPGWLAILCYVILIVAFTFLYAMITFSPDRISDNIQKRWGYIPWIRPWKATAKYINGVLMHLCLWWGLGLAVIACYTYICNWIPFLQNIANALGWLPAVVTGSGIIIIVWVVQELINKISTDMVMKRYEKY